MKKKIDHEKFLSNETDLFGEWKNNFNQLHPDSFTAQKLFLINPIRLKYPLKEEN